nr:YceH family protein [Motiliproteus sp. SC1-56]
MEIDLTPVQARVIGALIEKEITTPDQYPLTLNGLTLACNQKSNRDPVMSLTETETQNVLDELSKKRLIREVSGFGSRVPKYKHRFCNTEFGELNLDSRELGIACVLLLRGAQTPGELRTRTARLCDFEDVQQVERVLGALIERGLVEVLPREPGKRESRYRHCFGEHASGANVAVDAVESPATETAAEPLEQRIAALEAEVAALKAQLQEILS